MEADLKLIQECGFNSFEEVVKKITEIVDIMRAGRVRAEKNLDRFTNEAKRLLKEGQKDKAKKELAKKKKYTEKIKTIDTQLNKILEKLNAVKNSTQMIQVLSATKYCNNLILAELTQKDTSEGNEGNNDSNENHDLIDNDKEITKYIEILTKFKKKKVKTVPSPVQLEQKVENLEEDDKFPQPENNNFPEDNNVENENVQKTMEKNIKNINNNFCVNNKNQVNPYLNNNNYNYNNISNNNNQFYGNSNNQNNNNFNNNNYNFNNISKQKNPYEDIF